MPSTGLPSLLLAVFAPLALLGCPAAPPPPDQPPPEMVQGAPGEPQEASPSLVAGEGGGEAIAPDNLTFSRFMGPAAATVTIHGVVQGITEGQVDFTAYEDDVRGKGQPEAIHVQKFEKGAFDAIAPAGYARPLFVTAYNLDDEGRPDAQRPQATLADALVIGQEDMTITLEPAPGMAAPDGAPPPPVVLEGNPTVPAEEPPPAPAAGGSAGPG